MYFKEYDSNITVLKNTYQDSNEEIKDCKVAKKYLNYTTVFEKIEDVTKRNVKAHDISKYSDTNEFVYTCEQMLKKINEISRNKNENYIYSYLEEPDSIIHALGVDHEYVKENVRYINSLICELCGNLENSLVVVIADHGLINTKTVYLEDYKELTELLLRRPSFEPRAVNFYIKDNMKDIFQKKFNEKFKDTFLLMSKHELLEKNIFGKGTPNGKIDDLIGDFVAFGISDVAIEWERDNFDICARHAGLTAEEMEVPLIIIDTDECKNS